MIDLNATLLAQIINFVILIALLTKLAWKPLLTAIAERQTRIANNFAAAEQDRIAAEQLKLEYEKQMQSAKNDAHVIVANAVKTAEATKEEILLSAREERKRMLKTAEDHIAFERRQALEDLREEVVTISVAAASKIIGQNIDEKINTKLVDDFINKLDVRQEGTLC